MSVFPVRSFPPLNERKRDLIVLEYYAITGSYYKNVTSISKSGLKSALALSNSTENSDKIHKMQ
jgi:hypothetical protein